jgi:ABC-type multidrug transport system fused ATPase/permease subunit
MNEDLNINKYFYDYLLENKPTFIICTLLLFTYPLQRVVLPKYYGKVISSLQNNSNKELIHNSKMLLLVYSLVQVFHSIYQKIQGSLVPTFSEFSLRRIFTSILNNENDDYENIKVGEILAKLTKIPNIVYRYLDILKGVVFSQLIVLITCIFHYYHVSLITCLVFMFIVVGVVVLQFITYKLTMDLEMKREYEQDRIYHHFQDVLNNLISILICKTEDTEQTRMANLFKPFTEVFNKVLTMNFIMRTIFAFFNIFAFILLNYILYKEFKNKHITKESFISSFIVTYSVLQLFSDSAYSVRLLVDTKSQIRDMEDFFNYRVFSRDVHDTNTETSGFVHGDIVFKNLSYKYKETGEDVENKDEKDNTKNDNVDEESYAVNNVSLKISKNENIGLVGHIGSGKSTVIKLLLKLIKPTSGQITIGGVDIKNITKSELYKHVFYVPQKPKLLNRTLYENIVYGIDVDDKSRYIEIIKANMVKIKLDDITQASFIRSMDRTVGNEGSKLSGGQRQIVWILRALLRKPSIIIMDEPTASLDKRNKRNILDILERLGEDKTVIVISHDDIGFKYRKIFMKGGQLKESFI